MRYHIELDDHDAIDLELSPWSGKEVVYYDGKIVSERRNLKYFLLYIHLQYKKQAET